MKTTTIIILYLILSFIPIKGFNQENYIIVGDTNNVLFTDIQDTCLIPYDYFGFELEYDMDINHDNELDFQIAAYYSSGASHILRWIRIEPYDNNKIAFADSIPAWNPEDTIFYRNKVKGLHIDDTIDDQIVFLNEIMYLQNSSALADWQIDINWGNFEFIPIMLETERTDNIKYGWIKVNCSSYSEITIESFAVETQTNYIILPEKELDVKIFPNPSSDFIYIKSSDHEPITSINIFNSIGKKQNIQIYHSDLEYKVSLENLPKGIFIAELKIGNRIYCKKIIKD